MITRKSKELKYIFEHFKIQQLRTIEEEYIKEYVKVMHPLSEALDVFQNEEQMSIGCVLPTLALLRTKMKSFENDSSIIHCQPLVTTILEELKHDSMTCFLTEIFDWRPFLTHILKLFG